jgi:hypothetical protein
VSNVENQDLGGYWDEDPDDWPDLGEEADERPWAYADDEVERW